MALNKNASSSSEFLRLRSFSDYPLRNESKTVSCMKLAEAGFERRPQSSSTEANSDEVYCRMCGHGFKEWNYENPWVVHRVISPNCVFLNTPPVATQHMKEVKLNTDKDVMNNYRKQLFPNYDIMAQKIEELENFSEIQHPFVPKRGNFLMLYENRRLLSFPNPRSCEAATYAKAGFVYDANLCCAVCVFCNVEVPFTPLDNIFLDIFHKEKSSSCPFIRKLDVENISIEDERLIHEKVRNQALKSFRNGTDVTVSYIVKHPEYNQLSDRLGTFNSWPALLAEEFPAQPMAECGLYFTNFMDSVKCFSCGIGLRNWTKGADPFAQHAKASPVCWYILQKKGQKFIDVAQDLRLTVEADYRETEEIISEPEKAAVTSSSLTPESSSTLASPLSFPSPSPAAGLPILDLDSVEAAMACQYTLEQITDAVVKFFIFSSGRYPNEAILLGTLRAADVNRKVICDQQQEIIKSQAELCETKTQLKAQASVIEATKSELARTQDTLQWQNLELRTELEQQFVGQIQQQNQALLHKDEVIFQKDEVIYQKDEMLYQKDEMLQQQGEVIQNNAIQLELKNREVEDLQRQLRSVLAALGKRDDEGIDEYPPPVDGQEEDSHDIQANSVNEDEFPVANCKVCLTNTSQIVFYPCKHLCCCDACATRLIGKKCPICREQNLKMEKVYVI